MKLKKMFAGVVAAAMMLTMSATAFAEESNPGTTTTPTSYEDMNTVTITKIYEATNAHTTSPAETFGFTIERTSVTDAASGVDATNMPVPTIKGVSYDSGEAGSDNKSKNIIVTLPEYKSVGIYTYTIKEIAGSTAGVTYRGSDISLVVTVLQGENGKVRVAAVHTENGGRKTDTFADNVYSAGSLTVSKTVTGNLGDRQKEFNVTVTFNAPDEKTVREAISYIDGAETKTIPANWTNGTAIAKITLKHDESVTFTNIPYGVTYTVVEDDYTSSGYTASYVFSDSEKKVDSNSDTVTITNNKGNDNIDTGIGLDSLPYIMILAMVAVAMVVFFGKKRFARD